MKTYLRNLNSVEYLTDSGQFLCSKSVLQIHVTSKAQTRRFGADARGECLAFPDKSWNELCSSGKGKNLSTTPFFCSKNPSPVSSSRFFPKWQRSTSHFSVDGVPPPTNQNNEKCETVNFICGPHFFSRIFWYEALLFIQINV